MSAPIEVTTVIDQLSGPDRDREGAVTEIDDRPVDFCEHTNRPVLE